MKRTIGLTVLLMMSGCGGHKHMESSYQYDKTQNEAVNIALATRMIEASDAKEIIEASMDHNNGLISLNSAVQVTGSSVLGYFMGSSHADMGFSAASIFEGALNSSWSGLASDHIFVWMPKEMAANEDEAAKQLVTVMHDAISKSLPQKFSLESSSRKVESGLTYYYDTDVLRVSCPMCDKKNQYLKMYLSATHPDEAIDLETGSKETWYWSYRNASSDTSGVAGIMFSVWDSLSETAVLNEGKALTFAEIEKKTGLSYPDFAKRVSANLPRWVVWYISPANSGQKPYFLRQGKRIDFFETTKPSLKKSVTQ